MRKDAKIELFGPVNGKKVVGNLDTGSSGTFNLTPAAVSYLGLDEDFNRAPVSTDVGYNGESQNRKGKVNSVAVGAISVDAPAVIFSAKAQDAIKSPGA